MKRAAKTIADALLVGMTIMFVVWSDANIGRPLMAWLGAATCAALAWAVLHRGSCRVVAVNLAVIGAILIGAEAYEGLVRQAATSRFEVKLNATAPPLALWSRHDEGNGFATFRLPHPRSFQDANVGSRLPRNAHWFERRYLRGRLLYDVAYTTNAYGFRHPRAALAEESAVLFGCSHTFGIGVGDDEHVANRLEQYWQKRHPTEPISAVSIAQAGWGPQQPLAYLEQKADAWLADTQVIAGVYLTFPGEYGHVSRAAGKVSWASGTPRYQLDSQSASLERNGFWTTGNRNTGDSTMRWLGYGLLIDRIAYALAYRPFESEPDDMSLFVAIVQRLETVFRSRYHAPFYVVLLPIGNSKSLASALRGAGLNVIDDANDWREIAAEPLLIPYDNHLTASTHSRLASLIAEVLERARRKTL